MKEKILISVALFMVFSGAATADLNLEITDTNVTESLEGFNFSMDLKVENKGEDFSLDPINLTVDAGELGSREKVINNLSLEENQYRSLTNCEDIEKMEADKKHGLFMVENERIDDCTDRMKMYRYNKYGDQIWSKNIDSGKSVQDMYLTDENNVYLTGSFPNYGIIGINGSNSKKFLDLKSESYITEIEKSEDGKLYYISDGNLKRLEIGSLNNETIFNGVNSFSLVPKGDIIVGNTSGSVKRIDRSGNVVWTENNVLSDVRFIGLNSRNKIFVADTGSHYNDNNGEAAAINYETGNVIWDKTFDNAISDFVVGYRDLYASKLLGYTDIATAYLHRVSAVDGGFVWNRTIDNDVISSLAFDQTGELYFAKQYEGVRGFDQGLLMPNETKEVGLEFSTELGDYGTYSAGAEIFNSTDTIYNQNIGFEVLNRSFKPGIESLNPSVIEEGENVNLNVSVKNKGDKRDFQNVSFSVKSPLVDSGKKRVPDGFSTLDKNLPDDLNLGEVSFSPDGDYLIAEEVKKVTGTETITFESKGVVIFDTQTWDDKYHHKFESAGGDLHWSWYDEGVVYSRDKEGENEIRRVNLTGGVSPEILFLAENGEINGLNTDNDNDYISVNGDGLEEKSEIYSTKEDKIIENYSSSTFILFSGQNLVEGNNVYNLGSLDSSGVPDNPTRELPFGKAITFSPDGKYLLAISSENSIVYNTSSWEVVYKGNKLEDYDLNLETDVRWIKKGDKHFLGYLNDDKNFELIDLNQKESINTFNNQELTYLGPHNIYVFRSNEVLEVYQIDSLRKLESVRYGGKVYPRGVAINDERMVITFVQWTGDSELSNEVSDGDIEVFKEDSLFKPPLPGLDPENTSYKQFEITIGPMDAGNYDLNVSTLTHTVLQPFNIEPALNLKLADSKKEVAPGNENATFTLDYRSGGTISEDISVYVDGSKVFEETLSLDNSIKKKEFEIDSTGWKVNEEKTVKIESDSGNELSYNIQTVKPPKFKLTSSSKQSSYNKGEDAFFEVSAKNIGNVAADRANIEVDPEWENSFQTQIKSEFKGLDQAESSLPNSYDALSIKADKIAYTQGKNITVLDKSGEVLKSFDNVIGFEIAADIELSPKGEELAVYDGMPGQDRNLEVHNLENGQLLKIAPNIGSMDWSSSGKYSFVYTKGGFREESKLTVYKRWSSISQIEETRSRGIVAAIWDGNNLILNLLDQGDRKIFFELREPSDQFSTARKTSKKYSENIVISSSAGSKGYLGTVFQNSEAGFKAYPAVISEDLDSLDYNQNLEIVPPKGIKARTVFNLDGGFLAVDKDNNLVELDNNLDKTGIKYGSNINGFASKTDGFLAFANSSGAFLLDDSGEVVENVNGAVMTGLSERYARLGENLYQLPSKIRPGESKTKELSFQTNSLEPGTYTVEFKSGKYEDAAYLDLLGENDDSPVSIDWSKYDGENVDGFNVYIGKGNADLSKPAQNIPGEKRKTFIFNKIGAPGSEICVEVRPYNEYGEAEGSEKCYERGN